MSYQPRHQAPNPHSRPPRRNGARQKTTEQRVTRPKKKRFELPYPAFIVLVSVILSVIIIFLVLTVQTITKRRWN